MPMVQTQVPSVERSLLAAPDNVAVPQAAKARVVEAEQQPYGAPPHPAAESVAAEPGYQGALALSQAKAAHKAAEAKWAHALQVRDEVAQQLKSVKDLAAIYVASANYEKDKPTKTTEQRLSGFRTACCPPCSASTSAKVAFSTAVHLRSKGLVGQQVY